MDYHELKLLLETPTIRLLRAQNAPLLLGFLYRLYKQQHRVSIPEGQLCAALDAELQDRREAEPLAYPQSASDYLADWCSDDQRWLRKYYAAGTDEPQYGLTTGSEKALAWLESLRETKFIGTESRLQSIFTDLEEILTYASSDPEKRIQKLEAEIETLRAEIDRIRATGEVISFTPVQMNERYARVLATARDLLGDFRQVEENFKRVAREIIERHAQPGITKGAIVEHMLDSHDALRTSEQGQSFFAFWELLLSPERQNRFQECVSNISSLPMLDEENRRNVLLRHFTSHLLREGEKVVESHQRMSASLRRVLDTAHLGERRRMGELLQEIRQAALRLRDCPPADDDFFNVNDFPNVFATMSRPLWQAPESVSSTGAVEEDENELHLDEIRRFRNLPQIRLQELRRNVETCLTRDYTITLQQVLDVFPPRNGVMEVVGYIIVASDESRHLIQDETQIIQFPPQQRWRVPRVLFCKG